MYKLSYEDKIDLCAEYLWDKDSTQKSLARDYGVTTAKIAIILAEFKIETRHSRKKLTYEDEIDLCSDYLMDPESTHDSLMKQYQISKNTLIDPFIKFRVRRDNRKT